MRLFIAFPVPHEPLEALQHALFQRAKIPVRLLHDFHCTVLFLGEIDEQWLPLLCDLFSSFDEPAFEARYASFRFFPSAHSFRAITLSFWPQSTFLSFYRSVASHFASFVSHPSHSYLPHVTLARVNPHHSPTILEHFPSHTTSPPPFVVNSLQLIRSVLFSDGPRYTVLKEAALS